MNILIALLIGGIAGWLASLIRGGQGFGFFGNIVLGIIGGVIGGVAFGFLGIEDTNFIGSILVSTVGAVIVLVIASFFKKA